VIEVDVEFLGMAVGLDRLERHILSVKVFHVVLYHDGSLM